MPSATFDASDREEFEGDHYGQSLAGQFSLHFLVICAIIAAGGALACFVAGIVLHCGRKITKPVLPIVIQASEQPEYDSELDVPRPTGLGQRIRDAFDVPDSDSENETAAGSEAEMFYEGLKLDTLKISKPNFVDLPQPVGVQADQGAKEGAGQDRCG